MADYAFPHKVTTTQEWVRKKALKSAFVWRPKTRPRQVTLIPPKVTLSPHEVTLRPREAPPRIERGAGEIDG